MNPFLSKETWPTALSHQLFFFFLVFFRRTIGRIWTQVGRVEDKGLSKWVVRTKKQAPASQTLQNSFLLDDNVANV